MKTFLPLLLLLFVLKSFAQVGFEEKTLIDKTFGVYEPQDMAVADLDGDNMKDIVFASSYTDLSWIKNLNSENKFSRLKTIAPYTTKTVNIADLNGDTFPDIIFTDSVTNRVFWCKNTNGTGVFGTAALLANTNIPLYANKIDVFDYDNDGDNDVLINYIPILNNGQGMFNNPSGLQSSTYMKHFADFNNDGIQDQVYIDSSDLYKLSVVLRGTNNTILSSQILDTFAQSQGLTTGDIDGDGDIDILNLFENGALSRLIKCYKNNGSNVFALGQTLISLASVTGVSSNYDFKSIEVRDLDNDGLNDIVMSHASFNKIFWFKNLGSGQFSAEKIITTNALFVIKCIATDIDNDGFRDIVSACFNDSKIAVFKNNAGISFANENILTTQSSRPQFIDAADLDNDGDTDVVAAGSAKISLHKNKDGLGNYVDSKIIYFKDRLDVLDDCQIKDIDNDGKKDIIFRSASTTGPQLSKIIWIKNDGAGNFISEIIVATTTANIASIIATDIDNDIDLDIICNASDNKVFLYKNLGNGLYGPQQQFSATIAGEFGRNLKINDMDGDGDQDVYLNEGSGKSVWYENSNGQGLMTTKNILATGNSDFNQFEFFDFDGDNLKDILYSNYGLSQIGWYKKLTGQTGYAPKIILSSAASNPNTAFAADLDNDGDQDIVFYATNGIKIGWIQNNGLGIFGAPILITNNALATQYFRLKSFDLNGDNKKDLLYCEQDSDKIIFFKNLGPFTNQISGTITADLDANGCTASDVKVPQVLVSTQNGSTTAGTFTKADGTFSFFVGANPHTTTITSPLVNYVANPLSHAVTFTNLNSVSTANFCLAPAQFFDDLDISIIPLSAANPGFTAKYQIIIKNKGTSPIAGSFKVNFDAGKITFTSSTDTTTSQTAGQLNYNLATLLPFQTKTIDLKFVVKTIPTVSLGDNLLFTAIINNLTSDVTPTDNAFSFNQTIIGSYDPNDITCVEGNQIPFNDVDKYLHYVIRFQNTGTAHAQRVYITNELDAKFDWSTLQLETSSHANTVEIKNGNQIKFVFDAIYLPPKIQNEALSNGFISYKIKPKANVVIGNVFSNQAQIYFDFNPAIITNIASTIIVNPLTVPIFLNSDVKIYPIPTNNELQIESKSILSKVEVYNELGQLIYENKVNMDSIDFSKFSQGFYFVKLIDIFSNNVVKKAIKN